MSQKIRKRIEEGGGWVKTIPGARRSRSKMRNVSPVLWMELPGYNSSENAARSIPAPIRRLDFVWVAVDVVPMP